MTKIFLGLLVILVIFSGAGPLEASQSETLFAPQNHSDAEDNKGESGFIMKIDERESLLIIVLQWLDKFLTSDASHNTSVISIWNQ